MKKPMVIAHRGASILAPEDSMSAISKAVAFGAESIQLDINMTRDGHPVLIHDGEINRTSNGSGWVKDMALAELKAFDYGSWFSDRYKGEKLLSLAEALEYLSKYDVEVLLELKNSTLAYGGLEENVVRLLKEFRFEERSIIMSFNHYSMLKMKKLSPAVRIGLAYGFGLAFPWDYAARLGADSLHTSYSNIDAEMVEQCGKRDILVNTFTIDDPKLIKQMALTGVDGIMTNAPDVAINALKEIS